LAANDRTELRRSFELLPPGDQLVLELRVIAGLSVEQTASLLKKAPGAVRTAQSRALERLCQPIKASLNDRVCNPPL
jgi:RNA polymerase sigma-70 factor (ECF subfamily)